ncbi:MAG TPA: S8 family serine peptidase [Actinoplanes sp.]|nr:S8 family serine peptidase [Actinoplanes sp.]
MTRTTPRIVALLVVAALVVTLAPAAPATAKAPVATALKAGAGAGKTNPAKQAKLDGPTAQLAAKVRQQLRGALTEARRTGFDVEADRVTVTVTATAGQEQAARDAVTALGGQIQPEATAGGEISAVLDARHLTELSRHAAVAYVRRPEITVTEGTPGEGVKATRANRWHRNGLRGRGVKVAIIDNGFAGLAAAQRSGDLPSNVEIRSFCPSGINGTNHGTAVAEIVHEMAPRAKLFLICQGGGVAAFRNAMDYAYNRGVRVVNFSVAVPPTSRGDGTTTSLSTYEGVVKQATRRGMLLVASAGNYGQVHWTGGTVDSDSDWWLEFGGGDELNDFTLAAGATAYIWLKWDEWPGTTNDYDLFLFANGQQVTKSASTQSAAAPGAPVETIVYRNTSSSAVRFSVAIQRYYAAPTRRFDLYVYGTSQLEHRVRKSSVIDPASFKPTLAVGAACVFNRNLASYSAFGPSVAGTIKPDITAPDSVGGRSYGRSSGCGTGFTGTSAASPHVAGAAALWLQAYPRLSVDRLRSALTSYAAPDGPRGKDNRFGSGHLRLP